MRLRRNEYCPVHKSLFCCGREAVVHRPRLVRLGVQRVEDPHPPCPDRSALFNDSLRYRQLVLSMESNTPTKDEIECHTHSHSISRFRLTQSMIP
jgi:hypothetical protein